MHEEMVISTWHLPGTKEEHLLLKEMVISTNGYFQLTRFSQKTKNITLASPSGTRVRRNSVGGSTAAVGTTPDATAEFLGYVYGSVVGEPSRLGQG